MRWNGPRRTGGDVRRNVTPSQQASANLMDRDRSSIERLGVRVSAKAGLTMRVAAVRAIRLGKDPAIEVRASLESLKPTIIDAMVAAHLRGKTRQLTTAAPQMRTRVKLAKTVYDDATDFLRQRLHLDEQALSELRELYTTEAADVLEGMDRLITRRIERSVFESAKLGEGVRQGSKRLRQAFDAAGITPASAFAIENTFRTQTQLAYSAGRWNSLQDPAVQEILWGFRYVTVGDDSVRPNHAAMHGITLPKDDPFWQTNFPPNGYSCRCAAVELFSQAKRIEPEPIEIDGVLIRPDADVGFGFNPGGVFRDTAALRQSVGSRTRQRSPLPA